jgi:hypothetical protein
MFPELFTVNEYGQDYKTPILAISPTGLLLSKKVIFFDKA